jgi:hypothetical protein
MKDEVSFFLGCGAVISVQHFGNTVFYQIGTSITIFEEQTLISLLQKLKKLTCQR